MIFRPREISSKVPPRLKDLRAPVIPVQKNIPRDPRFDSLCGNFKEKVSSLLCCSSSNCITQEKQDTLNLLIKIRIIIDDGIINNKILKGFPKSWAHYLEISHHLTLKALLLFDKIS